ncbi:hypothetical protein ACE6H2_017864 [Prunus campanulata]
MRKPNTKCIILISFPSFSQQPSKRRISVKQNLKKARVPVCLKSKSTESKTRARFFCAWPGSRAKNRRSNRISKSEVRSPLKYRNDEQQLRASKLNDVDLMDQRRSGFIINREGFYREATITIYTSSRFGVLEIGPSTWPSRLRQRHYCAPVLCFHPAPLYRFRCDRPTQDFLQDNILMRFLSFLDFQRKLDIMMILRIKAYKKDVATGFWNNYDCIWSCYCPLQD